MWNTSEKDGNTNFILKKSECERECGRMQSNAWQILYYADLSPVVGSEQGGVRPVLIIQNDVGNKHSPTVICAAITSRMNKAKLPTHVEIDAKKYQIVKNSVVLLEQIRTIDKLRLKELVCHLDQTIMKKVDEAIKVSFELHT